MDEQKTSKMKQVHHRSNKQDQAYEFARWILQILEDEGFMARLAGGCVRDRLLGIEPKDYDIATNAHPEDVTRIFKKKAVKVIPTGIDHGTVTLLKNKIPVEVTTLRRDVETDGRHAKIIYTDSFEEDAARRDFTMNALYEDKDDEIFDYFNGSSHLKEGRLVFVGNPLERIREDYLRILRFFRFWASLDLKPDTGALDAVRSESHGLKLISQERINSELFLMLTCEKIEAPVKAMHNLGVFHVIFPEISSISEIPGRLLTGLKDLPQDLRPIGRLIAVLLYWIRDDFDLGTLAKRLKLSKKDQERLLFAKKGLDLLRQSSEIHWDTADALAVIDEAEEIGGENQGFSEFFYSLWYNMLSAFREKDTADFATVLGALKLLDWLRQEGKKHESLRKTAMPIDGTKLIKRFDLRQGRRVGEILNYLKRSFRNGLWSTEEEGMKMVETFIRSSDH